MRIFIMTDGPGGQDGVRSGERERRSAETDDAPKVASGAPSETAHTAASTDAPVTPIATRPTRRLTKSLRRFFWMDERVDQARGAAYGRGRPGWDEYEFALALMADADQLGEPMDGKTSALLLYRAAAALMIRVQLLRVGMDPGPPATTDECWARLAAHPSAAAILGATGEEDRSFINSGLGLEGERLWAKLPKDQRARAALALRKFARRLGADIEADAKRLRRALLVRWLRILVAALAVGVAICLPLRASGRNLALHRPVTVVTPHPAYGTDPSKLVDGDRQNLGFHSIRAPNQHVTIDLGSVQRISRVVVYNRFDCCAERAVPIRLEVSTDGRSFQLAEERHEPFDRWEVELPGTMARALRLVDLRDDFFHLSEVEVY
jgi:hypothetical protein